MNKKKARVIAYYLPQFHPIPENDKWWGKGFTEWTNVTKAKPLFKGHYQPKLPADLGFYDLRMPEIREAQAQLAREAGIEGFCYWHYWFGNGKRLLERPFNEVLESGKPDFPFCLGWANESWSNSSWHKAKKFTEKKILMEQTYSESDYEVYFYDTLKAFKDKRYIYVDGKPLFVVFSPTGIPDANKFINIWNKLALENGLNGIHFVGISGNLAGFKTDIHGNRNYYIPKKDESAAPFYNKIHQMGFDAVNSRGTFRAELCTEGRLKKAFYSFLRIFLHIDLVKKFNYKTIIKHLYVREDKWENVYPTLLPNWDRSARSGVKADVYYNSTPELFEKHIKNALSMIEEKDDEHKILFLQSWNEWAEGNYVEPDLKYGHGYLNALKKCLLEKE